jgi:hypothetical protein
MACDELSKALGDNVRPRKYPGPEDIFALPGARSSSCLRSPGSPTPGATASESSGRSRENASTCRWCRSESLAAFAAIVNSQGPNRVPGS